MLSFLKANIATIVVVLLIIIAVILVIISMNKRKKSGKSLTCGGNCESCVMRNNCNYKENQ